MYYVLFVHVCRQWTAATWQTERESKWIQSRVIDIGSFCDDSDADTATFSDIEEHQQQLHNESPGYSTDDALTETHVCRHWRRRKRTLRQTDVVFVCACFLRHWLSTMCTIVVWDIIIFFLTHIQQLAVNFDNFITLMHLFNWLRKLWSWQTVKNKQTENKNRYAHTWCFQITWLRNNMIAPSNPA